VLVDDSLQREDMGGTQGDKHWNICEDTPGGHAPEKLSIVDGVEYLTDSLDEDDDIMDEDDEDDDIIHDGITVDRPSRKQVMPQDPVNRGPSALQSSDMNREDRFNPSFQNKEMWKSADNAEMEYVVSGDVSIRSDQLGGDHDTVSELATTFTDEHTLTNHTYDTSLLEHDDKYPINNAATPATEKRIGGRRNGIDTTPSVPTLDRSEDPGSYHENNINNNASHLSASVPDGDVETCIETEPLNDSSSSGNYANRTKVVSKSAQGYQKSVGSGTGKSPRRKSSRKSSKRRAGKRPGNGNAVPSVVPASTQLELSPSIGRSPLSSSLASTPTSLSMVSSGRQSGTAAQTAALQTLREQLPRTGMLNNKPLQLHVGRESSLSFLEDDDHTLGASTITTNFSTTQRTYGDNTVSSRSLFRSERMKGSDLLKVPQRRCYDSDEEVESSQL